MKHSDHDFKQGGHFGLEDAVDGVFDQALELLLPLFHDLRYFVPHQLTPLVLGRHLFNNYAFGEVLLLLAEGGEGEDLGEPALGLLLDDVDLGLDPALKNKYICLLKENWSRLHFLSYYMKSSDILST